MMKLKSVGKKITACLAALAMTVTMVPAGAMAAGYTADEINTVENSKITVNDVLTNTGKIRVKFNPVNVDGVMYKVMFKETNDGVYEEYDFRYTTSTNYLITGLDRNTKYTVKVAAVLRENGRTIAQGNSSSLEWAITTPSGKYSVPAAGYFKVESGYRSLEVEADTDNLPGDVRVQVKYKKTSEPSSAYKTINGDDDIEIRNLASNTKYTVKIRYYIKDIKGETAYGTYSSLKWVYTR